MKKRTLIPALVAAVFATGCTFTADPNRDYNPYNKRQSYALNTVTALGLNEGMKDYSEKHLKQGLPGPSSFSTLTDFAYIFSPAGAGVLNSTIATVAHPTNGYAGYRSAIMGWEPRVDDTRSVEEALIDYFTKAEKASLDTLTEMGFGEFYTPDEKPYQLKLSTIMSGNLYSATRVWHFTHPDQSYQCTKRNECMLIMRVAAHKYSDESVEAVEKLQKPASF